jgi:hypothetical protein
MDEKKKNEERREKKKRRGEEKKKMSPNFEIAFTVSQGRILREGKAAILSHG